MAIEKVRGIVTDMVKYSDRQNIVTLFARERGRVSLLSPAGNGKNARTRNAALMPLSVISADINFNPVRDLQFLGNFQRDTLWRDLYFNPVKSAVGIFMAEFVNAYMRQSPPDPQLWDYVVSAISTLDRAKGPLGNYHIAFLLDFLHFAGIRPDLSDWREDAWLDMRGGCMTILPPHHGDAIGPDAARVLPMLGRMTMRTAPLFKLTAKERREILHGVLRYFSLHFPGLSNLNSPSVLTEVFR